MTDYSLEVLRALFQAKFVASYDAKITSELNKTKHMNFNAKSQSVRHYCE